MAGEPDPPVPSTQEFSPVPTQAAKPPSTRLTPSQEQVEPIEAGTPVIVAGIGEGLILDVRRAEAPAPVTA